MKVKKKPKQLARRNALGSANMKYSFRFQKKKNPSQVSFYFLTRKPSVAFSAAIQRSVAARLSFRNLSNGHRLE